MDMRNKHILHCRRKVAVTASASGQHVQLMPGQQASLGRQGGEIVVGEVNIQQVVDWKNGMFVFG